MSEPKNVQKILQIAANAMAVTYLNKVSEIMIRVRKIIFLGFSMTFKVGLVDYAKEAVALAEIIASGKYQRILKILIKKKNRNKNIWCSKSPDFWSYLCL